MLIKTNKKEPAFRAIINTWLKDKTIYCNDCGTHYQSYVNRCTEIDQTTGEECGCKHIGTNMDHCMAVIKQNKELAKTRLNDFGSNKSKDVRFSISMPIGLFYMLDNYKKSLNRPGLFKEKGEQEWFMRTFPAFRVQNRV